MTSVLIVGGGAREHALVWKLGQSPDRARRLLVAPGNAGTRLLAENVPVGATDLDGLVRLVEEGDVDLTIVGPEAPLALGLADRLRATTRTLVVGPDARAARLESSKAFAKDLMRQAGVPTARYGVFDEPAFAFRHLLECAYPVVVKADGLAAGKGVVICDDIRAARSAVEAIMMDRIHGSAGNRVVIEKYLSGPEVSLLALVGGERVVPRPPAQDHKRLLDGDAGPNTGGMGAYAPVPFVDAAEAARLTTLLIEPVVRALADLGTPYRGILFAGLVLTPNGPRVLEYNCRFGDPEAQVILPLLADDLLPWLLATARGELQGRVPAGAVGSAAGVVLAAPGYPEKPLLGAPIHGLDTVPDDVLVFHAGTALDDRGDVITAGGRVLTVVGTGPTLTAALERAYAAPISFEGMQRRNDIGSRGASPYPPAGGVDLPRIAVLASGNGSNLQAIIDACARGELEAQVAMVVSHEPEAGALDRARQAGIPAVAVPLENRRARGARRRLEERVLEVLLPLHLDLIVLVGWMLIMSEEFLNRCGCPAINVHPALLDRFPVLRGAHAVRDAIDLGLPFTGVSVHIVTADVDAGPVVISEQVEIVTGDDEASLYDRIKKVEHRLLPMAIGSILSRVHTPGGVYA